VVPLGFGLAASRVPAPVARNCGFPNTIFFLI